MAIIDMEKMLIGCSRGNLCLHIVDCEDRNANHQIRTSDENCPTESGLLWAIVAGARTT
jgi:hypothetical protein